MLDKKIISALNKRIASEEFSSRLYLYMSLWFQVKGYANLADLYKKYASEEMNHADWAIEYLTNYDVIPELKSLTSPVIEFTSCKDVLEQTLAHELQITKECEDLYKIATEVGKPSLQQLALTYCKEQDEEISKSLDLLDHLELSNNMLDFDNYVKRYL